jgi:protein strawberry notch
MTESLLGGASAAPLSMRATAVVAFAVVRAARQRFTDLERSRRIDAAALRNAMEAAFGASDASGAWTWKNAYDACEAATVLFLRRYGVAMFAKATSPAAMLPMLARITNLLPTQTRRSEESEPLQQFSTPIGLAFVASVAAAITPADVVLEPSAGTGLLAILAELAGASLVLNEFADSRAGILSRLFPAVSTTQFDAAHTA